MEPAFWQERWANGQIGFHEGRPNTLLVEHADTLRGLARLYVPLCGKAVDLAYLRGRGHHVTGTELVGEAIAQLFSELGEAPTQTSVSPYTKHEARDLVVLEGDAFALTPDHTGGPFDGAYDRAAFVAIDPKMRRAYAETMARVVRPEGVVLMVTFDYPQEKVSGPPWSVPKGEVEATFGADFDVTLLAERAQPGTPKQVAAGVHEVHERAHLLRRR
jgi:thiopurine S-methyltransferase